MATLNFPFRVVIFLNRRSNQSQNSSIGSRDVKPPDLRAFFSGILTACSPGQGLASTKTLIWGEDQQPDRSDPPIQRWIACNYRFGRSRQGLHPGQLARFDFWFEPWSVAASQARFFAAGNHVPDAQRPRGLPILVGDCLQPVVSAAPGTTANPPLCT